MAPAFTRLRRDESGRGDLSSPFSFFLGIGCCIIAIPLRRGWNKTRPARIRPSSAHPETISMTPSFRVSEVFCASVSCRQGGAGVAEKNQGGARFHLRTGIHSRHWGFGYLPKVGVPDGGAAPQGRFQGDHLPDQSEEKGDPGPSRLSVPVRSSGRHRSRRHNDAFGDRPGDLEGMQGQRHQGRRGHHRRVFRNG